MKRETINKVVLLLVVATISLLFLAMIQPFLLAIFMAALFAAMTRPLYRRLLGWFRGNRYLAAGTNLLLLMVLVLIPLILLGAIFLGQAVSIGQALTPLVRDLQQPGSFADLLHQVPYYEYLLPYENHITRLLADAADTTGRMLVGGISTVALGTVHFLFMSLVFLYTLFFLQIDGPKVIDRILYYLPLTDSDERQMLERFTSVTRAMVKGTLLIGLLQGGLAGLAFAVAGVGNAVFWGTVMVVLSIVPGIGSAVVWVPAAIGLMLGGQVAAGIGLAVFCGLVVGSIDNVLRPILVGKDANMHELMIFFGTLGGLIMFGMSGLLIGPVVAALFITMWEIYGDAFKDMLPPVGLHPELFPELHGGAQAQDRPDAAPAPPGATPTAASPTGAPHAEAGSLLTETHPDRPREDA
ncbi:MAG: AI-2E family transporter [Chromatiaceae bacterium]|nr:MAG: AI-2E family transporter [Chromatiaceae bacterium]